GAVDGWSEILKKHGSMTLSQVLQPAIDLAETGFPVSSVISRDWKRQEGFLRQNKYAGYTYLLEGNAPEEGTVFKNQKLALTMKLIAEKGRDVFYKGKIAREVSDYMKEH